MNIAATLLTAVLVGAVVVRGWLTSRQLQHVRGRYAVSTGDRGDHGQDKTAADHAVVRTLLDAVVAGAQTAIIGILLLAGGLARLRALVPTGMIGAGAIVVAEVAVLLLLMRIMADALRRFVVDSTYGVNRMTPQSFIIDAAKKIVATAGAASIAGGITTWLMQIDQVYWWFWVSCLQSVVLAVQGWLGPLIVAPLFEQVRPLADGPLRARLAVLLRRCGFDHTAIFVTNESHRSARANARASGMAGTCRIELSDTLVSLLSADEIEAVAAHEAGHLRRHHRAKDLILKIIVCFAGLAVFSFVLSNLGRDGVSGLSPLDAPTAVATLVLLLPVVESLLTPITSYWYRRLEYEADAFAASKVRPGYLIGALQKLGRVNATNLSSDPIYAAFYSRHPDLKARRRRLIEDFD